MGDKSAVTINAKAQFGEDVEEAHTQLGLTASPQNDRGETPPHAFWGLVARACVLPEAGSLPSATPRPGLLSAELRASLGLSLPGAAAGGWRRLQLLGISQRASPGPAALGNTASTSPRACRNSLSVFSVLHQCPPRISKQAQGYFPLPLCFPQPTGARSRSPRRRQRAPGPRPPRPSRRHPHSRSRSGSRSPSHSRSRSPSHSPPLPVPPLPLNLQRPPPYCPRPSISCNTGSHLE